MCSSISTQSIVQDSTQKSKRIDVLDALRGFALAGILITHMVNFYYYNLLPLKVENEYVVHLNKILLNLDYKLIVNKFYSIFSFMFGVSFGILQNGFMVKKGSFKRWYIKRMILLFLIGFIHHLIWKGDNLMSYAPLGVLLLYFSRLPQKWILILSIFFMLGMPNIIYQTFSQKIILELDGNYDLKVRNKEIKYFNLEKYGTLLENIKENSNSFTEMFHFWMLSGRFFITFGYFLLGFYALKSNLFSAFDKNKIVFQKILLITSIILIILFIIKSIFLKLIIPNGNFQNKNLFQLITFNMSNLFLSLEYISIFCFLFYYPKIQKILMYLAPVGKLAITNYIFQSIIGVFLFFGFGLGLFMKTTVIFNLILAIGVFTIEIILSALWLKKYSYGPLEWIWRYFTNISWKIR